MSAQEHSTKKDMAVESEQKDNRTRFQRIVIVAMLVMMVIGMAAPMFAGQ